MPGRVAPNRWPLVGREPELEQIQRLRGADHAPAVVLSGPAGVGKSRLAREALERAEADGAVVIRAQGTRSAARVPLFALAGLFESAERPEDPVHGLRSMIESLRERAAGRPVVVGVDDAQLLDATSAAAVLHLASTRTAFVLATVRAGEPMPDAIVALWKDVGAPRLELDALSSPQVGALLEAALSGPVESATSRRLHEWSDGNVLYLGELVLGALASEALSLQDGLWRLTRGLTPPLSLSAAIEERIGALAEPERRAIELLALGEPLRVQEAAELVGMDTLAATEERGMIVARGPAEGGDVRLAHPLFGEVVRARMSVLRGLALRTSLAETVAARQPLSDEDALRVVRWRLEAGASVPSSLMLDAAHAAASSGDPDLGAELAAKALADGAGPRAALVLARAHVARNRFPAAEAVLAEVEGTIDDRELAFAYLQQRLYVLAFGLSWSDELEQLLERAAAWWADAEWQRQMLPLRIPIAALRNAAEGPVEGSLKMLSDPDLDETLRRQMQPVHATNLYLAGRTREAFAVARGLRPQLPLNGPVDEHLLSMWISIGFAAGFDAEQRRAAFPELFAQAIRLGDHAAAAQLAVGLAGLARQRGRFRENARWLAEAEVHLNVVDSFGMLPAIRAYRIGAASAVGQAEAAEVMLERMREGLRERELIPLLRPHVLRGEAWALVAAGDPQRARERLLEGAVELAGYPLHAAELLYDALLAGEPPRVLLASFTALRERCDAPLVAAYADHAAAAARRDGPALLEACDAFEQLDNTYYAMFAAADASRAFTAAGRADSARRAAKRAGALHALGEGIPLPLTEGLSASVTLTRRERQLVDLAGRGLSNQEIADRLVLSVRTVESHLYRAMQKLGVDDRRRLRGTAT